MTTVSMANAVIQSSLVLASALLMAWVLRRRSAALRHAILAVGVVCACITPFVRPLVPEWDIKPVSGVIVLESNTHGPDAGSYVSNLAPAAPSVWKTTDVVFAVWASGAVLSLLVLAAGMFRLRQLRVAGTPLSQSRWRRRVHAETAAIGLRRHVTVVEVQHPTFAATWGVFRPTVVVPSNARDWSPERFRLVLAHEFAHIRRRDWLVHMAAAVVQSVCWFNPLAWLANRELRRLCEQACDDVVLGLGVDEAEYAGHLIDLARVKGTHRRQWMFAPAEAMARRSSLEGRVRAMLDTKLNRRPLGTAAWIVVAVSLIVLAAPAAAVGVSGQGGPGSLAGTLLDPHRRPVPNADMTLLQAGKATGIKARTDAAGEFVFTDVPAGAYDLNPGIPGFGVRYPVTVRAGQTVQTDVTLRIGQLAEELTVASREGNSMSLQPSSRPWSAPPPYDPEADPCRAPGVSACLKPPTKIRDARPVVPAGRGGDVVTVVIEGEIGIDGTVQGAHLKNPTDAQLGQAGLDAVNQWLFTPTRLNGEPVPVTMTVTINFASIR